jgi:hypothetical protein
MAIVARYKRGYKIIGLLIDEYDAPLHTAYQYGYYDKMVSLMQTMLSSALKDNEYLGKAVLTGILKVAKESIFSGLNNLEVATILRESYKQYFGFTEEEVISLLKKADREDKLEEVRRWYNGYNFSGIQIYNPWSILNYLKSNCLATPYWVNTSSNQLIKDLMTKSTSYSFGEKFQQLVLGNKVRLSLDENVVFRNLSEPGLQDGAIWSLLLFAGYLTMDNVDLSSGMAEGDAWIPNWEITTIYNNIFKEYLAKTVGSDYSNAAEDLVKGRFDKFARLIRLYLLECASYYDFTMESNYHCFVLGLLVVLKDRYYIRSNREYGVGRADLVIVSKTTDEGMIIEFKATKNSDNLEESAKEGLRQIVEHKYDLMIKDFPHVKRLTKACLAFSQKEVFHLSEIEML